MLRGQALLSSLHGVRSISILSLQADCDGASIGGQSPVGLWAADLSWRFWQLEDGTVCECMVAVTSASLSRIVTNSRCAVIWDQS